MHWRFARTYGIDVSVGTYHVPIIMTWIAAGVIGIVAALAFREA